ncbi:MAG TPA: hypothetical protein VFV98_14635 [Vicinamibacterales bacterium]|nr:hypothetical protein [Vicinamibacterales bacterium]
MRRLTVMVAAVSLLAAAPVVPTAQSPRTATIDAFVTDREGKPILGLADGDFRVVTADGKTIPVTGVREVTIPLAARGKATAVAEAPLEATNRHAADARLFVVVAEPVASDPGRRPTREFMDELVAGMRDVDQLALFVPGHPDRSLPPTDDTTLIARALDRFFELGAGDTGGLTSFMRYDMPKVYRSLMAMRWTQRAIVLLTPGYVGPEGFYDEKSWAAWAQRANAPMHGVDVVGGARSMGLRLLPKATDETGGLLLNSQPAMPGLASKILSASSHFYEVQIEIPANVKTDQSIYTSVRTHPTSKTRARLRVRAPEPLELSVHATNELKTALAAALPMDEIPLSFSLESTIGATAATVKFLTNGTTDPRSAELPEFPFRMAFGAVTDAGKMQEIGVRDVGPEDVKIEGCCMAIQHDVVIPKDATSVRVAVYQHPTGKVGAVFIPVIRN